MIRKKLTFGESSREKHVDDSLTGHERWLVFSQSDDPVQRQVCIQELVECAFQAGFASTCAHILPRIKDLICDDDAQIRSATLGVLSDFSGYLIQSEYEDGYVFTFLYRRK